jgi:hypothetical protein
VPVRQVVEAVEAFKDIERLVDHLLKAARMMAAMRAVADNGLAAPDADPPAAGGD